MKVELADLGAWRGLVAEYDPEDDAVRIDARAFAKICAQLGNVMGSHFVAYALAHEVFHRDHPRAYEGEAHAHAQAVSGVDTATFERALRS